MAVNIMLTRDLHDYTIPFLFYYFVYAPLSYYGPASQVFMQVEIPTSGLELQNGKSLIQFTSYAFMSTSTIMK